MIKRTNINVPPPAPAAAAAAIDITLALILISISIAVFYMLGYINKLWSQNDLFWTSVSFIKTAIELAAGYFAVFYLVVAFFYYEPIKSNKYVACNNAFCTRKLCVIYLCCDDFEYQALESIVANCDENVAKIFVHDDSKEPKNITEVNNSVARLIGNYSRNIEIIRRSASARKGGKPGAINNALQQIPKDTEYVFLCDSDSFLYGNNAIQAAMIYFQDKSVAIVQFRNVGHIYSNDTAGYKILSLSIDFYDAFVNFMDTFGWSPFLGHNAIFRVAAIKDVDGFTPGQLADDIDMSVKLRLSGYRLCYIRSIECGERHPNNYGALRLRTQKWAYGCTQILLHWGARVFFSRSIDFIDKATFFLTVGYYHLQLLLFIYLGIFYILLPFNESMTNNYPSLFLSAGMILFITYLPSITYFIQMRSFRSWPIIATFWGFTYGSQDIPTAFAIIRCILGKKLQWIPTNLVSQEAQTPLFLLELLFGASIIIVAVVKLPFLLLIPTTIFFAGKFLVTPWLDRWVFGNKDSSVQRTI